MKNLVMSLVALVALGGIIQSQTGLIQAHENDAAECARFTEEQANKRGALIYVNCKTKEVTELVNL